MSATDRMIAYHIERLKDKNPEVQLKSIRELELLEAVEAFDALEAVYKSDTDETVREAARQLGLKLYKKKKAMAATQQPDGEDSDSGE